MTDTRGYQVHETAQRKELLAKLRARLKYGLSIYHFLRDPGRARPDFKVAGLSIVELRDWVDDVMQALRESGPAGYCLCLYLSGVGAVASDENKVVMHKGTPMERNIHAPNLEKVLHSLGTTDPDLALDALNYAIDNAVREYLRQHPEEIP